jgi:hypothetical protein
MLLFTNLSSELYYIFKDYVTHLVHQSREAICVNLYTALPDVPVQTITSSRQHEHDQEVRNLEIRVLTPAFYSRFVHYAYTSEAFDRECIFTEEKNRTLWISRPALLPLLLNKPSSSSASSGSIVWRGYLDELRWTILRKLRCAPAISAYPVSSPSGIEFAAADIRTLPFSDMDLFVRSSSGRAYAGAYRRCVTKLFLARRLGLGFADIPGPLDMIVRLLLCYLGAAQLMAWSHQAQDSEVVTCVGRVIREGWSPCLLELRKAHGEWWWLIGTSLSISVCHFYGLMKGYS